MEVSAIGLRADGVTNINQAASALDNLSNSANKVTQSTNKLTNQQNKVPPTFDRSSKSVDSFARAARRAGGIIAAAFSVRAVIGYADAWTNLNSRIELSIDAQENAADVMGQLSDIARQTYSDLTLTADAFIRNSVSLSALGKSTQEQLNYTSALNNALALSGAEGQRAESVQMALTRAMSEGALRGEDLNNVLNYGSRISQVLADSMGVTVTELKRLGAEGKITGDILFESLIQNQIILEEEYSGMGYTIGAAMRVLSNSILETVGALNEQTGAAEAAAKSIGSLADYIRESERLVPMLSIALQGLAVLMAGRLVGAIVTTDRAIKLLNISLAATQSRAAAAALSVNILKGAMGALGGPAGLITIVAGGLYLWANRAREASEPTVDLANNIDALTESYRKMGDAQAETERLALVSGLNRTLAEMAKVQREIDETTAQQINQYGNWEGAAKRVADRLLGLQKRLEDLGDEEQRQVRALESLVSIMNDRTFQRDLENFLGGADEAAATFERWDRATQALTNDSGRGSLDALFDELIALGNANAEVARDFDNLLNSLDPARAEMQKMEAAAKTLEEAFKIGLIPTAEEYVRLTDLLTGSFHQAGDAAVEAAEKAKEAPGPAQQEWRGFERFLSSAFMTMGDDAEDAWDRIANSFNDMLVRMIADAAASGISSMFRGEGFMSGFTGGDMGGFLSMFGGGGGGGTNWGSLASSATSIASSAGTIWAGAKGIASSVGNMWGSQVNAAQYYQMMQSGSPTVGAASLPSWGGPLAAATGALYGYDYKGPESAVTGAAGGYVGYQAGAAAGSYVMPGIGTAIGAVIGGILGGIGGGRILGSDFETTRGGLELGFGEQGPNFSQWLRQTKKGGWFSSSERKMLTTALDSEVNSQLHETYNHVVGGVMALYETAGIAVDEASLRAVEIAKMQIGTYGKSEQTAEEIAGQVTGWFSDLETAILDSVIRGMDADTLRSWGALRQQTMFDPLQAARDNRDFQENNTLLTAYGRSTDAVMELRNAFDGSIESANILNQALQVQQQAAFDLAGAYLQAQSSVNTLFMGLSESIRTSLMGQEELYNYQRSQVHALGDALHTMTDPQRIMETADSIEQRISRMWSRLDEGQAEELGPQYLTYIEEINRVAQRQLEQGLSDLGNEQTDVNRSIQMAIQESANVQIEAANQQVEAARMNIQAAQMNQRAMVEMAAMYGRGQQMEIAS